MTRLLWLIAVMVFGSAGSAFAQHEAAVAAQGEKVYAREKCTLCHSIAGKGNQKGPLDDVGTKLTADEIRKWIVSAPEMAQKVKSTRKPVMKAYPNIPKDDLEALVVYLQSLKKKA